MTVCRIMGCGQSKHVTEKHTSNNNLHTDNDQDDFYVKGKGKSNHMTDESHTDNANHNNDLHNFSKESAHGGSKYSSNEAGTPLQPGIHTTNSQLDFFRILDEKIEQGKMSSTVEKS